MSHRVDTAKRPKWSFIVNAAALTLAFVLMATVTVQASTTEGSFHTYTSEDYHALIAEAFGSTASLDPPVSPGAITGKPSVDARIWDRAFERGYEMTPIASGSKLVWEDGYQMQSTAASAWNELQRSARDAGHRIEVTSAFRTIAAQRIVFNSKLYSTSAAGIDARLAYSAPPGASRHHTGYVLDIKETGGTIGRFRLSSSFRWLSRDNYFNAKRFGFVPSYPADSSGHGPNPEAWEYVYVGLEALAGEVPFIDVPERHFSFNSVMWLADNGLTQGCGAYLFCPDLNASRGEVAAFMKRILESTLGPTDPRVFTDASGHPFESAIGWLGGHGITVGCNPPANTLFCPDRSISRGEMSALFKRAVGDLMYVNPSAYVGFTDSETSMFVNAIGWLGATGITAGCNPPENSRFCPTDSITRGELAVFLKRIADRT